MDEKEQMCEKNKIRGAGGAPGGVGQFVFGLGLLAAGIGLMARSLRSR